LGVSVGIESTGKLNDPNITDVEGASINIMAGLNGGWNVASYIDNVVAKSTDPAMTQSLINYVQGVTGVSDMSLDDAVTAFKLFNDDLQRPLILKTFFNELVASGREATAANSQKGYARGYAAIDALFPGSRTDHDPYRGDISMLFSRVY